MATRHLPLIEDTSSLRRDGRRNHVHPADVAGRYTRVRNLVFALLIAIYAVVPWIQMGGKPAVFLDIEHRKFYLLGATFNAQDFWLAFFLLTGVAFLLVFLTAMWGRIWCGYACPQTVFMEAVFRRVERLIEGPRQVRLRRDAGSLTFDKAWRKGLKHVLFVVLALLVAHIFLSYFVSLPALFQMMQRSPAEHPEAFGWVVGITGLMYFNYAWFREQLCLVICPYGRLQSVLTDADTLVIGYDEGRGEPRGKTKNEGRGRGKGNERVEGQGDCIECTRCVQVCPTGIDIRNGLQLDCIGCSACVDACDDIMDKVGRPRGLIRYDSLNGLEGKPRRFVRPRLFLYLGLGAMGLVATVIGVSSHQDFEANLLRLPGSPYSVEGGRVRNSFQIHVVNKDPARATFTLTVEAPNPRHEYVFATPVLTLDSLASRHVPVFVTAEAGTPAPAMVRVRVAKRGAEQDGRVLEAPFITPGELGGRP